MAIVARPLKKNYIYLYRNSNPLYLVASKKSETIYGCSSDTYILDKELEKAMGDKYEFVGIEEGASLTPYALYKVGLKKPEIEPVAEYQPMLYTFDKSSEDKWTVKNFCHESEGF